MSPVLRTGRLTVRRSREPNAESVSAGTSSRIQQGRKRKPIAGRVRRSHLAVGLALTHVPKTAYNRGLFADPAGSAFARAPDQAWGTR